ncbi:hypothetical protein [Thiomicrospira microaerophila]|uniref:hypothetical protein n=1 Tax=Thiomicrospira microaerophila TaxID=406020 RepID=UPI0005C934C5|nr:hypothetical protein [Thiomicrospira microaerophila]
MESIEVIQVQTNPKLFDGMQSILNEAQPFITSPSNLAEPYEIFPYIRAQHDEGVFVGSMIDLNVFTTLVKLGKGEDINGHENEKLACALMYFFILSGILVEPNIALYERAQKSSHEQALEELEFFRKADNIEPDIYAEIALGKRSNLQGARRIPRPPIVNEVPDDEFSKKLNHWRLNYLYLMKVVELVRTSGLTGQEKMKAFIQWMHEEMLLNNVVTHFVSMYFSPARESGMLKGIGSDNPEKLKAGLHNAAWDLTYLRRWQQNYRVNEPHDIWLFSTRDKALHKLAKHFFIAELDMLFTPYWDAEKATDLCNFYKTIADQVHAENDRESRQKAVKENLDALITEYEQKLNLGACRTNQTIIC